MHWILNLTKIHQLISTAFVQLLPTKCRCKICTLMISSPTLNYCFHAWHNNIEINFELAVANLLKLRKKIFETKKHVLFQVCLLGGYARMCMMKFQINFVVAFVAIIYLTLQWKNAGNWNVTLIEMFMFERVVHEIWNFLKPSIVLIFVTFYNFWHLGLTNNFFWQKILTVFIVF